MTDPVMLLSQVHGEGRITFRALKEAGYDTLESVARAEVHVLADQARLSAVTALRLKSGAQHMMGRATVDGASRPPHAEFPERGQGEEKIGPLEGPAGVRLSEGVLAEEAVLLEQPFYRPDPVHDAHARARFSPEHPADLEPSERGDGGQPDHADHPAPPRMPDISAAAQAASALPHASGSPHAPAGSPEQTNRSAERSFWSFGGPAPR